MEKIYGGYTGGKGGFVGMKIRELRNKSEGRYKKNFMIKDQG